MSFRFEKISRDDLVAMMDAFNEGNDGPPKDIDGIEWDKLKWWSPGLNPVQQELYECGANYILAYGERGSGKTMGAIHKLVQHCVEHQDALAVIIVGVRRQAEEGGAYHKLQFMVLPEWKRAMGLQYTESKINVSKDTFLWIANKHGGWSKVLLLSMPVEKFIADRIKGPEPSFILVDEAQTLRHPDYFDKVIQQVGRRPGIPGPAQQVVYTCNPDSPDHWLYKRFFEHPVDKETGEWNPAYAKFHVPIEENIDHLPEGYYDKVIEATAGDEIERRRMVYGEWIERPEADAIFKEDFKPQIHVKGDAAKNLGLLPLPGYPVDMGYDLGSAHSSVHFLQFVPIKDWMMTIVFDELNTTGEYMPYRVMVPKLIERMDYWSTLVGKPLEFRHISDDSAFNQFRAKEGSFDAWDVEQISQGRIKLKPCPKGADSIYARVRELMDALKFDRIRISAMCPQTIKMLQSLPQDKEKKMVPKRCPFIHSFDSLTYPMLYYSIRRMNAEANAGAVAPEVYRVGQGNNLDRQRNARYKPPMSEIVSRLQQPALATAT